MAILKKANSYSNVKQRTDADLVNNLPESPIDLANNLVVNGNFDFWQRQVSFNGASTGVYTADRWKTGRDGAGDTVTVTQQIFTLGQIEVPNNPKFYYRYNQTVAGAGTTIRAIENRIEFVSTLSGKSATVVFYAKADSPRTVGVKFTQAFGTGGSPSADVNTPTQNAVLTTSWQKFVMTFDIPSISGKTLGTDNNDFLDLVFVLPLNSVMILDFAQVAVFEGQEELPFVLAGKNYGGELSACQRYYAKTYRADRYPPDTNASGAVRWPTIGTSAGDGTTYWKYPVTMRAIPTVSFVNPTTGAPNSARGSNGLDYAVAATVPGDTGTSIINTGATVAFILLTAHVVVDAEL